MRIFFATDLHGSDICFKKFCAAATFYGCDALILGGDVTGKLLVPVILGGDLFSYRLGGLDHEFPRSALEEEVQRIADIGYYAVVGDRDLVLELADPEAYEHRLQEEALARARAWVGYAEERLEDKGVPILFTLGNDDDPSVGPAFEGSAVFVNGDGRVVDLGEVEVASLGWSNPTPWNTPRECPEDQLAARLRGAVARLREAGRVVFNFHAPPRDTPLDLGPQLDEDLKVVTMAGVPLQRHVGSTAVRSVVEEYQPLLSLHGHIHESRNAVKLGRSVAINVGSEYSEGVLLGAVIDVSRGRARHMFTAG